VGQRNSIRLGRPLAALCGLALALGWSNLASAQQANQTPVKVAATAGQTDPKAVTPSLKNLANIRIQSSLVETPVTVMDSTGEFVENLSKNDFQVFDNGVQQRIAKFGLATAPVALVVAVQTNQAVAPLLDQVRPLGSLFSDLLLGKQGQAAVICFDTKVRVVQNFTSSAAALSQTLQHITDEGAQARLNDALARAILMLANRPAAERRVIIVFSEGFDRGSETTKAEIVRAATGADVAIYGLQFKPAAALLKNRQPSSTPDTLSQNLALPGMPGTPRTPGMLQGEYNTPPILTLPLMSDIGNVIASAKGKNLLQFYAEFTGGSAYSHWKASQLQKQLMLVALEVNSQYMLAYAPSTLNEEGFHRMEVKVLPPDLKVRARAGYFYKIKTKK